MPTLNWIQETAEDRYWERGSSGSEIVNSVYNCRVCGNAFISISERDRHEVEHPVQNPAIFINNKEVCGERVMITSPIIGSSIYLRNVEFLSINGVDGLHHADLIKQLAGKNCIFLDLCYGNVNIKKRIKIDVCIADPEEIKKVDKAFTQCFEKGGLNDSAIIAFTEEVKNLKTVKSYSDGLVRYLQGLMAKDNRSETCKFEVFVERFNQATSSLKGYETGLSRAIRAVVNFTRNDFAAINQSGIPLLERAVDFFRGGKLLEAVTIGEVQSLPVDYATEFILSKLLVLYKEGSLDEIEAEISTFSPKYLSLQDKMKFDYVCWQKSIQAVNREAENRYARRLRSDDVFVGVVENK